MAWGSQEMLCRPCVDCGLETGNFCETMSQAGHSHWQGGSCLAVRRVPDEVWAPGQRAPLRTYCEALYGACHFCRGVTWRRPQPGAGYGHAMRR
eukprot:744799-Alexandrium_andersonii.AAC.1